MRFTVLLITRSKPRSYKLLLSDGQTAKVPVEAFPLRLRAGDTGELYQDERGRNRMRLDAIDAE